MLQRPVKDKPKELEKKGPAVALLIGISQNRSQSCTADLCCPGGGLCPVWYSLPQGRAGRCQAEHLTLASVHLGTNWLFRGRMTFFFCSTELFPERFWVSHFVALVQSFIRITDNFSDQKLAKQHTDLISFTTAALEHALHQNNSRRNSLKSAVCYSDHFCNKLMQ